MARLGRGQPNTPFDTRSSLQDAPKSSDASLAVSAGITAGGVANAATDATLAVIGSIAASEAGGLTSTATLAIAAAVTAVPACPAELDVTAGITADGVVLVAATRTAPVVVPTAAYHAAAFYRGHGRGQPNPAIIYRSSSQDATLTGQASLTVTAATSTSAVLGTTSAATLNAAAAIAAASSPIGQASVPVTVGLSATGGARGTSSVPVTATITAAGVTNASTDTVLAVTANVSPQGASSGQNLPVPPFTLTASDQPRVTVSGSTVATIKIMSTSG